MSKKKENKLYEQRKQVSAAVATIQDARGCLERLAFQYNDYIDEASMLNEDAYSDQLIEDQDEINELVRNFKFLEVRILEGAVTAEAFSRLSMIPKAMDACAGLLRSSTDLVKLGKKMSDFKTSIDKARVSLKDMRKGLAAKDEGDSVFAEIFGTQKEQDPKRAARIEAAKKARERRIALKIEAGNGANSPVAAKPQTDAATDIDAITAMMDEENRKD